MSFEGLPAPKPKAPEVETPAQERPLMGGQLLKDLMSETPVHGLGYPPFTEDERKQVEVLLGHHNADLEQEVLLAQLDGEFVLTLQNYFAAKPFSEERKVLNQKLSQSLKEAWARYYKEDR